MKSFDLDYLFNRVYDVLLWLKYFYYFVLLDTDPKQYLIDHETRVWDGLRDRGWLDSAKDSLGANPIPTPDNMTLWEKMLEKIGVRVPDSDGDGIPNSRDTSPYDPDNLTESQLKERYEIDYSYGDHIRDLFGIGPKDSDGDGVPNSYEEKHGMDPTRANTDYDGLSDGSELALGTNPLGADTDGDYVMDGRDEMPLDSGLSSKGIDSDGDGVSDSIENILGMDIRLKDTDNDKIPDGMDTYPLDITNLGGYNKEVPDINDVAQGINFFEIQNPVFSFVSELYSVLTVFILFAFAYTILRFLYVYIESYRKFDEHFNPPEHKDEEKRDEKIIKEVYEVKDAPAGIPNLPVMEELPVQKIIVEERPVRAPRLEEFNIHPRWAIVEGYLSSKEEALWRIGILEADNMLADALREKGYLGDDVGAMLTSANFRSVQLAWDAHKIRNRIAHEGGRYTLTEREARRAFALYEAVLKELNVI